MAQNYMVAAALARQAKRFILKRTWWQWNMAALMCAHTRCDTDKAERVLGYKKVPVRACIEDSIAWLRPEGLL